MKGLNIANIRIKLFSFYFPLNSYNIFACGYCLSEVRMEIGVPDLARIAKDTTSIVFGDH